jgi:hypothetical protein
MVFYAKFDSSASGPTPIVAYYDTDFHPYPKINFSVPGFFELSEEDWKKRKDNSWHFCGKLIDQPERTDKEKEAIRLKALVQKAEIALKDSDSLVLKHYENDEPVSQQVRDYRKTLRSIIDGSSGSISLPDVPKL